MQYIYIFSMSMNAQITLQYVIAVLITIYFQKIRMVHLSISTKYIVGIPTTNSFNPLKTTPAFRPIHFYGHSGIKRGIFKCSGREILTF